MNNKDGELTEEEYREVIKYGGGMLINIIIGVVAAVAIAVYMGMLKKGVVFLMLLLPLRQYCGGYHMKNHNKCIVASIIIYFLQLMLIKNLKVTISVQIVMLIFALVIILMLAPVDNINNKMNYEEKNYLKKKIRVILIIELFLYAIFIVLSVDCESKIITSKLEYVCLFKLFSTSPICFSSLYVLITTLIL